MIMSEHRRDPHTGLTAEHPPFTDAQNPDLTADEKERAEKAQREAKAATRKRRAA